MKQTNVLLLLLVIFQYSCIDKQTETINKIWVNDSVGQTYILNFEEKLLQSIYDRQDYYYFKIDSAILEWDIRDDTLFRTTSSLDIQKDKITKLTDSCLYLQGDYMNELKFYAMNPLTSFDLTKQGVENKLINNSYKFNFPQHNKTWEIDFISKSRCILKWDYNNFQIDLWQILKIRNELFLITKNKGCQSTLLHFVKRDSDTLVLEYVSKGIQIAKLCENKKDIIHEENLIAEWSETTESYEYRENNELLKRPCFDKDCKLKYTFNKNGTYICSDDTKGVWSLSKINSYILLDSLADRNNLIYIEFCKDTLKLFRYKDHKFERIEMVKKKLKYKSYQINDELI